MSKDDVVRVEHARIQRIGTGCYCVAIDEDHPNVGGIVGDNVLLITMRSTILDGVRRMRLRLATEGGLELVATILVMPPEGEGYAEWEQATCALLEAMIDLAVTAVNWRAIAGAWPEKPEELARDPKQWAEDRACVNPEKLIAPAAVLDNERRLDVMLHLALGGSKTPLPKA